MKYNVALLCTSAGYFYIWVAFALALFDSIGYSYEPVLFGVYTAFVLLFPLSVFGSLFFVSQNRKKSDKWFLGLPLLIVILTSILSLYVSRKQQLNVPVELFFIILALVAPASALFIQSLPEEQRESAKKYVKIATAISIYVALIGFMYLIDTFLLFDHPLVPTMLLMFMIYVVFLLPFIGICLVLLAKDNRNGSDSSISLFGKL